MQSITSRVGVSSGRVSVSRPAVSLAPVKPTSADIVSPSRQVSCNGLFGLGLPEIAVIAGVAALVFGPSKLPELGKGLGKTVKSFQSAAQEFESELKSASGDEEKKETAETPKPPADAPKKE